MRHILIIFLLFISLAICLIIDGCGGKQQDVSPACIPEESIKKSDRGNDNDLYIAGELSDMTAELSAMVDSVMSGMSLEDKVGQCFMPAIYAVSDEYTLRRLREYIHDMRVGGIVLLKGDLKSAAMLAGLCRRARVPLFVAIDAEWGLGMRLEDAPDFPKNGKLSPKADELILYDYGREVARECRRVGISMILGPVVDVTENPRGVIGARSFGSDPVRVADLGVAYAKGVESGGVISVAKHFPGHGSPSVDSHKGLPVVKRSLRQLDSIDIYPFKSYIDTGLSGVMVGHIAVPAIDPDALPAAVSKVVINDLLRADLGFKGLVLTDALNMKGASGHGASAALSAGADILVGPVETRREIKDVIRKIKKGDIGVEEIDERCRRILFYKFLTGIDKKSPVALQGIREDVSDGYDSLYERLTR